jgi:ubiquinone biosynthesis protein Coq4
MFSGSQPTITPAVQTSAAARGEKRAGWMDRTMKSLNGSVSTILQAVVTLVALAVAFANVFLNYGSLVTQVAQLQRQVEQLQSTVSGEQFIRREEYNEMQHEILDQLRQIRNRLDRMDAR